MWGWGEVGRRARVARGLERRMRRAGGWKDYVLVLELLRYNINFVQILYKILLHQDNITIMSIYTNII